MNELYQDITDGNLGNFLEHLEQFLQISLIGLGESKLTIGLLIWLIVSITAILILSELVRKFTVNKVLARYPLDLGTRKAIGTIIKYILISIGFFTILQNSNVDLSALGILAGAIGVGIGFGLQNITNNFISGLIILFERPIKEGDRIEVNGINGDVVKISARSTTVVTNDNITIIVPNSQFIDNPVINWSHNDRNIRFHIPVGVAYKEDPEKVRKILLEAAAENAGVLSNPPCDVLFQGYGESSIDFDLRVWTSDFINKPLVLKSQLYYDIFRRFRDAGIEIPFPQQDVHIRSGAKNMTETGH
ncbi:mechanosensitive ion channel family protein [Lunatimonas salinarum]|uniref:mechanosensitive ion channel family protein n=1 Tax=Lunatimonas salinarum TaxID=1774590 RepID=UPI001AE05D63|nr:mechanosensitive ion channel domain-containing protein [Lunatimonas salinarum]